MRLWRYALVAGGVLLLLYGGVRLVAEAPDALPGLVLWMVGIVLVHDALLAPLVVGIGWLLARAAPPRARRYLQAALIVGGLITVIAVPLIVRRGTQPPAKALLLQDFGANLAILLALVAAVNLGAYLVAAARDRTPDAPADPID